MKNRKIGFIVLIACLALAAVLGGSWYTGHRNAQQYQTFYNSNINGVLDTTYTSNRASVITVNGQEYIFQPSQSADTLKVSFEATATTGDAVKKPARADTLTLVHGNTFYKYTFAKPE